MFAEDTYRNALNTTVAGLEDWARRHADTGSIEMRQGAGFWRVVARPATPGACPMTLVLRADQKFDLSLGSERFEDRDVEDFAVFGAIAEAVAEGRVERIHTSCAMTGAPLEIATRVLFKDGNVWSAQRPLLRPRGGDGETISETKRFLPYRR